MNTLFIGRHMIVLDETSSTNTYAMQVLKEKHLTEGTLIQALNQSSGRGQYGNTWVAEPGKNLTFSLVIQPTFLAVSKQFYLSKITSLAVLGMLTELLPASQYDIQIKWPNDILVNGQKVAGILIENLLQGSALNYSIIGVGINVNQAGFPPLKRKAASLLTLSGKEYDLNDLLARFCKQFEALYLNLKQDRIAHLNKQYLSNLFLLEREATFALGKELLKGRIVGVEESGLLSIKNTEGKLSQYNFKEIEFVE